MPEAFMSYKLAIQLYKLYNSVNHSLEWVSLNLNQILTTRQINYIIMKTNKTKVGLNILSNRLHSINGLIPLTWLNQSICTFKINCKKLLLGTQIMHHCKIFQDSLGLSGAEGMMSNQMVVIFLVPGNT